MSEINDGGFAFPQSIGPGGPFGGMNLRDYFAGQALAGWLASFGPDESARPGKVAEFAYEVADATLKAREASHE